MAFFDCMYSSSPVLAMPPQAAHQSLFNRHFLQHQSSSFRQRFPRRHQLARTGSVAGRKRSRDEASVNLDPPEKLVEASVAQESESEDEWVYGPGMVLIKKSTGYVADASSQSGTWVEEKAAENEARKADAALLAHQQLAQSRPSLRSNKSQRLEMPTTPLASVEATQNKRSSPSREINDPMNQPIVDDFTMYLGIGWSRISEDEHLQAAARGWARYIENHYPVNDVKIRLQSRGLQSYLVEASEGYFLFAENLRQGQLVSTSAERAINNLKSSPIIFDGPHTMEAMESPKPVDTAFDLTTSTPVSVEMDMS